MALAYTVVQGLFYLTARHTKYLLNVSNLPSRCQPGCRLPLTCCPGAARWLGHPCTSSWEEMSHLPGSVCGQIPPGEGGRGSTCTPARLWSLSKASSRFAETPPCWGMHLPGREVRACSLSWVLPVPHQEGEPAGAPVSWQAVAGGREEIFPVSSLVGLIQWKESQEKPLLPARSREQRRAVACGQRLPQVSEPSSPGPVRAREGPCFVSNYWQVRGLLQMYFLRHLPLASTSFLPCTIVFPLGT